MKNPGRRGGPTNRDRRAVSSRPTSPCAQRPAVSLSLTSADLVRLEAASRTLTSPLGAGDPRGWLAEAGAAVRDLIGGTGVVFQYPTAPASYFSLDAPHIADGVNDYVQEVEWDGTRFSDPVVDAWSRMRRARRMELCSWDINLGLVEGAGLRMQDAPIVTEVLQGQGVHDFAALMGSLPEGETMVWVLHERRGGFSFGERTTALLGALLPSLRSGLDAVARLGAHRAALDAVSDPLAAFGADGRELYRNAALVRLLEADPEGDALARAVGSLGWTARDLARGPRGSLLPTEAVVRTARGAFTLRTTALPPGLFGADPAVLVTVAADLAPEAPTPEAVRERTGLTLREAEVALLLAEGLTNAQIADRLFVAGATVKRHVEAVLCKLDVASRAAVAARIVGLA